MVGARQLLAVLKDATRLEVIRAINAAHDGQGIFSPTMAAKLAQLLTPPPTDALPARLTRREADVLGLLRQGLRNEQIAERLAISTKTVRNTLSQAYAKAGVSDRLAAADWAREHLGRR